MKVRADRFLKPVSSCCLEIVSKEDMEDLKLLKATRGEKSIPFEGYLANGH